MAIVDLESLAHLHKHDRDARGAGVRHAHLYKHDRDARGAGIPFPRGG